MSDRDFINMAQVGPIRATADEDGYIAFPSSGGGGGATATVGLDMKSADLPLLSTVPIDDALFEFSPADLAAATVARFSISGGSMAYGYVNASGITSASGHPMADGDTVVIYGNANINGLHFAGSGTITITLEGPAA